MRAFRTLLAAVALGAASSWAADADMAKLARDRGCTVCHQERAAQGPNTIIPSAPSWHEIAARYRGKLGAEDVLTGIVMGGSDPDQRHWKNQAAFASMPANEVATSPAEARALVRWILSSP